MLTRWLAARARFRTSRSRCAPRIAATLVVHQPDIAADRREAQIRIVDAQREPMLGPRSEHAIRLETTLRHQVVHKNADVALIAFDRDRRRLRDARAAFMPATSPCAAASS
jgi:hypothetical protein